MLKDLNSVFSFETVNSEKMEMLNTSINSLNITNYDQEMLLEEIQSENDQINTDLSTHWHMSLTSTVVSAITVTGLLTLIGALIYIKKQMRKIKANAAALVDQIELAERERAGIDEV